MKLRIWWIRSPPGDKTEYYKVNNLDKAINKYKELTFKDLENVSIYANGGGLEILENGRWTEYYDREGEDISGIVEKFDILKELKERKKKFEKEQSKYI